MKILLLIGLIVSLLIFAYKIYSWLRTSIIWLINPDHKIIQEAKEKIGIKKWGFIIGGVEHFIIFGSLLASLIIIF